VPDNDPHSYGPITQSAILLAEINNPDRDRVFCMAVTNEGAADQTRRRGARPSTRRRPERNRTMLKIRRLGG
jgi:hypothetical protein